jgi:hypothetical protein
MEMILVKNIKRAFFAGLLLLSAPSYGQDYRDAMLRTEAQLLDIRRIEAEIDVMEREVAVYDKSIRENERTQEKMKDRADRLKYKVMSELSKMDTTRPHDMTYKEWQLKKAESAREQASVKLAKAQQSRQEKVLALGEKTKELHSAQTRLRQAPDMKDISKRQPQRKKQKNKQSKEYKAE